MMQSIRMICIVYLIISLIIIKSTLAQTAVPVLEAGDLISAGLPLSGIAQSCDIYKTKTDDNKLKLIHTPYFAFKKKESGKIDIEINRINATKSEIVLTLLCSPVELKKSIADYISTNAIRVNDTSLKKINESDIITPIYLNLTIKDATTGSDLQFLTNNSTKNSSPIYIKLKSTPLNTDIIQRFITEIQDNTRQLRFQITYDLNAKFITSSNQLAANIANIKDTRTFQQLGGNASAFTWSAAYEAGSITKNASTLTRQQKNSFEGSLKQELTVLYDIQKPEDLQFLQTQLDSFLKTIFTSLSVSIDDNFTKEIARLNQYDLGLQKDMQPDEINSFISKIKQYLNDDKTDELDLDIKAKGSGLFGLLSADLDTKYTKKEFVKKLQDNGWDIEQKGNIYIPKSIELYSINEGRLTQSASIKIKINHSKQDAFKQEFQISTSESSYFPERNNFASFYSSFLSNSCPIGTILPYAGNSDKLPNGWKFCTGDTLKIKGNEALFNIIGYNWGRIPNDDFKLPDLRGVFLRGVNYSSDKDADRVNSKVQDLVGNYQPDDFASHNHEIENTNSATRNTENVDRGNGAIVNGDETNNAILKILNKGGSETRPKNVTVNYIIRCN